MHIGWTDRQIEMINSDGKWQSFNNLCPILAITSSYVCQSSYVKGDEKQGIAQPLIQAII